MVTLRIQLCMILMVSILTPGLQGMSPESQSKHPFFAGILKLGIIQPELQSKHPFCAGSLKLGIIQNAVALGLKKCVVLVEEDMYRNNAIAIRDIVFSKYRSGELLSVGGTKHAEVDSISIDMIDPNVYVAEPTIDDAIGELKDEESQAKFLAHRRALRYWDASNGVKRGLLGMAISTDDKIDPLGKNPAIYLSTYCTSMMSDLEFSHAVFHELAHTLDVNIRKAKNERDYPWLQDDIKNYPLEEVDCSEWHADKQALAWLKAYKPHEAKALKKIYQEKIDRGDTELAVPTYPPNSIMVEWLSKKKDCLHIKEIKKLGLLW